VDSRDEDADESTDAAPPVEADNKADATEIEEDDDADEEEDGASMVEKETVSSVAEASDAVMAAILRFLLSGSPPPLASAITARNVDSEAGNAQISRSAIQNKIRTGHE
jgi:hypothetical protein